MATLKQYSTANAVTDTNTIPAVGIKSANFQVDGSGQASYVIPVEVPPGIAGLQPKLEINYNHRQPNGILGVGWSLTGLSAISRTKANYAIDNFNGAVSYDSFDRYALDGQRLINIDGEYGEAGTLYYTELQSWRYVKAGAAADDGFTVTTKNGEKWCYGTTDDSRILAAGTSDIRVWALHSITDRNGNSIIYTYTQSPRLASGQNGAADEGAYYIDSISYTLRDGLDANRFVNFVYEQRPDVISSFVGGYPVPLSYRLITLSTALAGSVPVKSFTFNYTTSASTGLSCITSITECGSDEVTQLQPTVITWQEQDSPGFDINDASVLDQHLNAIGIETMDVNGDGCTDVVQLWLDHDGAINASTYLATPANGGTQYVLSKNSYLGVFPANRQIFPADLTGDGRSDLLIAYASGSTSNLKLAAFLSDGSGFVAQDVFDTGDTWSSKHLNFFPMDVNGDGRTDLVEIYAHYDPSSGGDLLYFRSYLSLLGTGSGPAFTGGIVTETTDPAYPTHELAFWPLDVNGDGMVDLVRIWQNGSNDHVIATSYISVSKAIDNVSFSKTQKSDLGVLNFANQIAFFPVDVNGDGVVDMLQIWKESAGGKTTLHFTTFLCNAGGGFITGPDSAFDGQTIDPENYFSLNITGGGLSNIINKWVSGTELYFTVYTASPSGTYSLTGDIHAGQAGSAINMAKFYGGDVNGDGKADFIRMSLDQNQQINIVPYVSTGLYPDLVTNIVNPLGGETSISYAPLTNNTVYTSNADTSFPQGPGLRYPHPITPAQFPVQAVIGQSMYVVSSYTQTAHSDINRFTYQNQYNITYADASINLLGRGFEGFKTISTLNIANGCNTVQTYNLDFPLTGTIAENRVDADSLLMALTTTTYESFVRATGVNPNQQVVEVLKTATLNAQYDYGEQNLDYAIKETFEYDDYGNLIKDSYLGNVDPATGKSLSSSDVVYHYKLFENNLLADGWVLGLPLYAKDSANDNDPDITQFNAGDFHLEKSTYTNDTYNEASNGKWDNINNCYLTTTYEYDEYGNRKSQTLPGGATTTYEYEPGYHTYPMQTTLPPNADGVSLVTYYGYDPRFGAEIAKKDVNGFISINSLDSFGRTQYIQGPVPQINNAASDPNELTPLVTGNTQIKQDFLDAKVVTLQTITFESDGSGGLFKQLNSLQSFPTDTGRVFVWYKTYVDGLGRERQTIQQTGQSLGNIVVLTDYDSGDKPVQKSLPFLSTESVLPQTSNYIIYTYDVLERILSQTQPAGEKDKGTSVTTWVYSSGGLVTQTSASGSDSSYVQAFVHHTYAGKDKVIKNTVTTDDNAITTYNYDAVARLYKTTDPATASNPDGVSNYITYDSIDRQLTLDNPDQNTTGNADIKALSYQYDASTGLLSNQTDAALATTSYEYDKLGRVLKTTFSDSRVINYAYDDASVNGNGRLTKVSLLAVDKTIESQYEFTYDAYGNTNQVALSIQGENDPFVITKIFNPQKQVISTVYPDSSELSRIFDFGYLVSQSLDGARVDYSLDDYTPSGKAGQMIFGRGILPADGIITNYTYNVSDQLYHESLTGNAGDLLKFSYQYDALGQLLQVTDDLAGNNNQVFTYLNKRLASAIIPGFDNGAYGYDQSGNIMNKDGCDYTYQAHFAKSITKNGTEVFSAVPDACGRTQTRVSGGATLNFSYDSLGCLNKVTDDQQNMVLEVSSDYSGKRLKETQSDGSVTLYIDAAYQVKLSGSETTITKYLQDGQGSVALVSTISTDKTISYFRRNNKGSITHTFDSTGAIATIIQYDGYGLSKLIKGPDDLQLKYEQRQWNEKTSLYYFGARYYDPVTGRFLTPDSGLGAKDHLMADVQNRYAFELNNPVNNIDTSGNNASWIAGLIIGIALIVVGVALMVFTGGVSAPLIALGLSETVAGIASGAILGAVVGAGINASIYSATHKNDDKFWGGYFASAAIGAAVGFVSGGAFSGIGAAVETASFGIRAGAYVIGGSLVTSGSDALNQFTNNAIDKNIVGKDVSLGDGVGRAAITGAIFGAVAGFAQASAEAKFLKSRYVMDGENLSAEPLELKTIAANDPSASLLPKPYSTIKYVENTIKTRAIMVTMNTASAITDASLEAAGL
ncbi:RHS repeat-associated core domain-containing protein [Mucilaginibacter pocheonensis]|uniref:RHS repeat-associated protein n=1 Tax=Mucilaginibacter pocheonensis TaxID=398050 RepID=A0ABU1T6V6_9SPHI|nr:SpvB/TcaC N-terminal domain-containing protein [Mucilaginibacter pocheonensis]MDR6941124.1 RHS repeat-associated protein [Mucilaginibacter pocheonensis]